MEYLLDGRDYAPGSQIGLPTQAADRRGLLNSLLAAILVMPDVIRLAIALTDCNEIEGVVVVKPSELAPRVTADCAKCSPPNGLYLCDLVPPELIDAVVPD